jgi:hypothetical protein
MLNVVTVATAMGSTAAKSGEKRSIASRINRVTLPMLKYARARRPGATDGKSF